MPGILQPVGAQPAAQPQQRFARVLRELQQPRNPLPLAAVALIFNIEVPLQRVRFRAGIRHRARRVGIQRFGRIKSSGKVGRGMWARQGMCRVGHRQLLHCHLRPTFPDSQLSWIRGVHAFRLVFRGWQGPSGNDVRFPANLRGDSGLAGSRSRGTW